MSLYLIFNIFLIIILSYSTCVLAEIGLWGQCANIQGSLGQCASGSECHKFDDWYSQCIPSSNPTTTTKPTDSPASKKSGGLPVWSQCANYYGSLGDCASGSECHKFDDWYSQCIPSSNPTTTIKPTTKLTTKPNVNPITTKPNVNPITTKPNLNPITTKPNVNPTTSRSGNDLITENEFVNAVTSNGYGKPSSTQFKNLVSQAKSKGNINTKLHLAMFLAEIMWESDGLKAMREYYCYPTLNANCAYSSGIGYQGQNYFGRGYIQLSWDYNYKAASQSLYGSDTLLQNPDQVASNDEIAWATAFWFWKTNVGILSNVQNGFFGSATNAINGALECSGSHQDAAKKRFEIYKKVLIAFNINTAPIESGCYN